MPQYKCGHAGGWFDEVDEAFSTQTCRRRIRRVLDAKAWSAWKVSWKKGVGLLRRGAYHHRDIKQLKTFSQRNIANLAEGIPVLPAPCAAAVG
jgi:hypothetical protein